MLTSAVGSMTAAVGEPLFSLSGQHVALANEASNKSAQAYNKAILAALSEMPNELAVHCFKSDEPKVQKFKSFLETQMEKGLAISFEVRRRERQGLVFSVELVIGKKQILELIEKFDAESTTM